MLTLLIPNSPKSHPFYMGQREAAILSRLHFKIKEFEVEKKMLVNF